MRTSHKGHSSSELKGHKYECLLWGFRLKDSSQCLRGRAQFLYCMSVIRLLMTPLVLVLDTGLVAVYALASHNNLKKELLKIAKRNLVQNNQLSIS